MEKKWVVYPKVEGGLKKQLLTNRNLGQKSTVDSFLQPHLTKLISAEKLFPDLSKAISRLQKAIKEKELIYIYGDYDVDGITASAILWETLDFLGAKVLPYIPSRHTEGYGLNSDALQMLAKEGAKVVITVDCGITAVDQATLAKTLGIDLIITDHHQPGESLPDSFATLHTTTLAGSGVAFKLAESLLQNSTKKSDEQFFRNLELATLGTVADMVPLVGDNRVIVKNGLLTLGHSSRIGLQAIYDEAQVGKNLGTYEIGFMISPRLNAMGRMESAFDSLRLLLTRDKERARKLAEKLGSTNKQRQLLTQEALGDAKAQVENKFIGSKLFVVSSEIYEEGVVGLVAGRLAEIYYRPTLVISEKPKVSKGSARSISGFNITDAIRSQADFLISHGGHPMAAGFSIEKAKIEPFRQAMVRLAESSLADKDLIPEIKIDAEIEVSEISEELNQTIKEFEPFGIGNPEPVFLTKQMEVLESRLVGKDSNHLKLRLKSSTGQVLDAVGFNLATNQPSSGELIDIVFNIRENFWNSQKKLEARIKDLKKST